MLAQDVLDRGNLTPGCDRKVHVEGYSSHQNVECAVMEGLKAVMTVKGGHSSKNEGSGYSGENHDHMKVRR